MLEHYILKAKIMIKRHEGFRTFPYKCTAGKLTIGYGRNLEAAGIRKDEAEVLLENDINDVVEGLAINKNIPYQKLSDNRKIALIDLCFNIGMTSLLKFKKMLKALRESNYEVAAIELLDSKYARQVPNRAKEIANIIRTGE